MTWAVVILRDRELNATLAGIEHNRWGQQTRQPIILCDTWAQGFESARRQGYNQALFVRSGTLFVDWDQWTKLINNYPHQGLIAHLIWPPGEVPRIDDQCWFADLTQFDIEDLHTQSATSWCAVRGDQNLHNDYTPLWIKAGDQMVTVEVTHFGQGLIARQLNNKKAVVNWSNAARKQKFFCYPDTDAKTQIQTVFADYLKLAENQFWIFNNENFSITTHQQLITPGSGLHWMFNVIQPHVRSVHVIDISRPQIDFCNWLWNHWDGTDYGTVCWNFIQDQALAHCELDQDNLSDLERLKLKNPSRFIPYVNQQFEHSAAQHNIQDFASHWRQAQQSKKFNTTNANLVQWILDHPEEKARVWSSNIVDYKWTKINTAFEDCERFKSLT